LNEDVNTGSSADWAKGAANVKYSYVLELRPGPNTPDYSYGFTLPEVSLNFITYMKLIIIFILTLFSRIVCQE